MKYFKRTIALFLSVVSLTFCACGKKAFSDNPDEISEASNSVVMLSVYDKENELIAKGSGFVAIEDGIIVTNYHVIEHGSSYEANTEDGMYFKIDEVVAYNAEKDVAILRTNANAKLTLLKLGNTNELQKGEKVIAIGSPLGLINTISDGLYSNRITEGSNEYLQFTAAISPGSSGGALFNDNGEVIGITSASYVEGQNLNLAIPSEEIQRVWDNKDTLKSSVPNVSKEGKNNTYSVSYVLKNRDMFKDKAGFYISGYIYKYDGDEKSFFDTYSDNFGVRVYIVDNRESIENRISFWLSNEDLVSFVDETQDGTLVRIHCTSFDGNNWITKDYIEKIDNFGQSSDNDSNFSIHTVNELMSNTKELTDSFVKVKGYVSSAFHFANESRYYLSNDFSSVTGYEYIEGNEHISNSIESFETWYESDNGWFEVETSEKRRSVKKEVLYVELDSSNYDKYHPGDSLTVQGKLVYSSDKWELDNAKVISVTQ